MKTVKLILICIFTTSFSTMAKENVCEGFKKVLDASWDRFSAIQGSKHTTRVGQYDDRINKGQFNSTYVLPGASKCILNLRSSRRAKYECEYEYESAAKALHNMGTLAKNLKICLDVFPGVWEVESEKYPVNLFKLPSHSSRSLKRYAESIESDEFDTDATFSRDDFAKNGNVMKHEIRLWLNNINNRKYVVNVDIKAR